MRAEQRTKILSITLPPGKVLKFWITAQGIPYGVKPQFVDRDCRAIGSAQQMRQPDNRGMASTEYCFGYCLELHNIRAPERV